MPQLKVMFPRVTMWALAMLAAPLVLGAPSPDAVTPPSADESQVVIKHTESVHEVILPHDGPYWSMAKTVGRVMDLMQSFGEKGPLFIQYSGDPGGRSPGRISVSVGFVASRPLKVPAPFAARERATELVVSRFVQGLAGSVVQQYGPMRDWVASHGYRVLGPIVELYEPLAPDDPPSRQRTEIRMPIQAVNVPSPDVSRKPAISAARMPESAMARVTDRVPAEVQPVITDTALVPNEAPRVSDLGATEAAPKPQPSTDATGSESNVPDVGMNGESEIPQPAAAIQTDRDNAKVVITLENLDMNAPLGEPADGRPAIESPGTSEESNESEAPITQVPTTKAPDETASSPKGSDPPTEMAELPTETAPSQAIPSPDRSAASRVESKEGSGTGEELIRELFQLAETRTEADQVWVGHLALRVQIIARHASASPATDRWSSLGRAAEQALLDFTPRFRTNPKAHAVVVFPAGDPSAGRKTALLRSMDQLLASLAARSKDAATLHLECVKLLKQASESLAASR